jgi:hypothetical protein
VGENGPLWGGMRETETREEEGGPVSVSVSVLGCVCVCVCVCGRKRQTGKGKGPELQDTILAATPELQHLSCNTRPLLQTPITNNAQDACLEMGIPVLVFNMSI